VTILPSILDIVTDFI